MTISIHTSIASQFAQRAMGNAQNSIKTSMERLSSGLRINNASDDAAGLAIASRMTSHIRSFVPLMRGMNDGISLLQVAGGGIRNTLDSLQRARELAVQAGNSIVSPSDREALDVEFQQMMGQVNHVSNNTEIFGIFPLKGQPIQVTNAPQDLTGNIKHITDIFSASGASHSGSSGIKPIAYIPKGASNVFIEINCISIDDDIQIFTADGKHLAGTPLSDNTWTNNGINNSSEVESKLLKSEYGFNASAIYDSSHLLDGSQKFSLGILANSSNALSSNFNGMNFTYSGDGDYYDSIPNDGTLSVDPREEINIDKTNEPLIIVVTGKGSFTATASWGFMPAKGAILPPINPTAPPIPVPTDGIRILTSATPGAAPTFVTIDRTPTDTATLGLVGSALNPFEKVMLAIKALDSAINKVGNYAAKHGAVEAGLDSAVSIAGTSSDITSAARSRIMDADFATETAQLTSHLIRSSASTAMSAQANVSSKLVLSLLDSLS